MRTKLTSRSRSLANQTNVRDREVQTHTQAATRARRYSVNLPELMAECDTNYLRLTKLFPSLRERDEKQFAVELGVGLVEVRLSVLERGPYTTLLRLTQVPQSTASASWAAQPRMTVRLYHDARCAEVVDYERARHFSAIYDYPNPAMRHPDEKAQVNRFLGEFLALCLDAGIALDAPLSEPV